MNQQLGQQIQSQQSLFKRAQEMANGKTETELQQIARNICTTRGIDFDNAVKEFNKMWENHNK